MTDSKPAETAFPVHDLIAERWSPRAFEDRSIDPAVLGGLLEAARWAPSCYNEQPWAYLVARRDDAESFSRLADCLADGNAWAKNAAALVLSVAKLGFDRNGKPNAHAWHDVGLASMSLVLQAESVGLSSHQMAGFDSDKARSSLAIPETHAPVAMIALGYRASADSLPDDLAERERSTRSRRALEEIAFGATWGSAPPLGS